MLLLTQPGRLTPVTKYLILILLISLRFTVSAQEMSGATNGTYSGIHSSLINPSLSVLSPYYLDINLVTGHAFFENNYLFLKREEDKFRRLLKTNSFFEQQSSNDRLYFDYYTPGLKHGYINLRVMGPSFLVVAGKHAFGFTTGTRSVTSVRNFPNTVAKFFYEGLYYPPQHDIRYQHDEKISFANLNWAEIGLNYSYIMNHKDDNFISGGVSIKYLAGHSAAYAYSDHVDYLVNGLDTLTVYDADMHAGLAIPIDYETNEYLDNPLLKGRGFSIDLGFTVEKKQSSKSRSLTYESLCSQQYSPYLYRVGISILDIGFIKFNDNALRLALNNGNVYWPDVTGVKYNSTNEVLAEVSNRFYGNPNELIKDDEFSIWLPTALSFQGDYNFRTDLYVSGMIVVPAKLRKASVVRESLMLAGLRYETRFLALGLTGNFFNWSQFNFGLHARFHDFFIGTDNLPSLLNIGDFTGMDIYAGIKISLRKGYCRTPSSFSCGHNEYQKFKSKRIGKLRNFF